LAEKRIVLDENKARCALSIHLYVQSAACGPGTKVKIHTTDSKADMAERVGYSIKPWDYPVMFSTTCAKTAWILAISMISPVATVSTLPHE
jgi:hypothetical protein